MHQRNPESNIKSIVLSVFASILAMAINYLISFLLTPYITKTLGTEAYGFVTLAKTMANYMIILTTFFNAYSSRFIVVAYHEGRLDKANSYFSTISIVNYLLFFVVCILGSAVIFNLEKLISIPAYLVNDVKLLFILDIVNYMLLTIANVSTVAAYIKNRLYITNTIKLIQYVGEAIVLVLLYSLLSPKVYYVGIALLFSTIIVWILNSIFKHRHVPELAVELKRFSPRAVRDLVGRGMWSAFNQLGNVLNSGLDLLVSNLMLSTVAMGELSIVKTLAAIFSTIPGLICQPFQPALLKYYAEKNTDGVKRTLGIEIKIMGFIAGVLTLGFSVLGRSYYSLWTPNENADLLYKITLITIVGFVFEAISHPLYYAYTLALKNVVVCIVTVTSGFLNVLGMYLLISFTSLELYAVVGTTTVLALITGLIFAPIYSSVCLKAKWNLFYPILFRTLLACSILFFSGWCIFKQINVTGWIPLLSYAFLIIIFSIPVYSILALTRDEWSVLISKVKKQRKS